MLDEKGKPIEPYIVNAASDNEEKVVIHYNDIDVIEKRNTEYKTRHPEMGAFLGL